MAEEIEKKEAASGGDGGVAGEVKEYFVQNEEGEYEKVEDVIPKAEYEKAQAVLQEKEEELKKFQEKDLNFSKYRSATEKEKAEIVKGFSEEKREMYEFMEKMSSEIIGDKKEQMARAEESVLSELAGDDKDLMEQIKEQAKVFIGQPETPEQAAKRLTDAYTLLTGKKPAVSGFHNYAPHTGYTAPNTKRTKYTSTPEGKEAYKKMFGHYPGEHNKQGENKAPNPYIRG